MDNTLYDYNRAHKIAIDATLDLFEEKFLFPRNALSKAYQIARSAINKELQGTASCHNRILYFQRMCELLKISNLKGMLEAYERYWSIFLDNMEIYDGVCEFLESVKGMKICLLSDLTAHIQHRKIQRLRLSQYIDFLVTSEEVGKEKPHPSIFKCGLKKLRLSHLDVCMIGDSFEKDITGAKRLKIKSFWLNKQNDLRKSNPLVTSFDNFFELMEYLK